MVDKKNIVKVISILKKKSEISMLGSITQKDPFYILITTVLSARNRDVMTVKATRKLFLKYKTPKQIAEAPLKKLEPLIKQSGFYKTKAKRIREISKIILKKYKGKVPKDFEELVELPGVGRKTAGCVMVYAFDEPALPVDIHVHVVTNRLGWVNTKTPDQTERELVKIIPKKYWLHVNEVFVIHGQTTCVTVSPWCSRCSIRRYCKRVGVGKSR